MTIRVFKDARLEQRINPTDQQYLREGLTKQSILESLAIHFRKEEEC